MKSLLRRAAEGGAQGGPVTIVEPAERDLVLTLDAFDGALAEAYDKKAPNALAEHAYRLSQAFSKFYAACPIMQSEPGTKASRLTLAATTLRQLELALDLAGDFHARADVAPPRKGPRRRRRGPILSSAVA